MEARGDERFGAWMEALTARHAARLTFPELRRCVQSLSSCYVERRSGLTRGAPLATAGRRAAFALFFAPLHFLLLRSILAAIESAKPAPSEVLDLGCGTGVAGAAWSLQHDGAPRVTAIDRNPWAVGEARFTLQSLRLRGLARQGDMIGARPRRRGAAGMAIVAAFCVDELEEADRARLLPRLSAACAQGSRLLIVEPIARRASPWWPRWTASLRAAAPPGSRFREDDWRFPAALPELLAELDRAAGLHHGELTGRSIYVGPADGSDQILAPP